MWDNLSLPLLRSLLITHRIDKDEKNIKSNQKNKIISLNCPFHKDTNPSFIINLKKGYASCFSDQCGYYTKDLVKFIKDYTQTDLDQTIEIIQKELLIKLKEEDILKLKETTLINLLSYSLLNKIGSVMRKMLFRCSQNKEEALALGADKAVDYLINKRGIPANLLHGLPLGVVVPTDTILNNIELTSEEKELMGTTYTPTDHLGDVAFLYTSNINDICAIKMREPYGPPNKVTTYYAKLSHQTPMVFGLYNKWYRSLLCQPKNELMVTIVEGEFDQLLPMTKQIESNDIDHIFLALGGKGHSLENITKVLSEKNISINLLFDHDPPEKKTDYTLLSHIEDVNNIHITNWPEDIPIGSKMDPDEFVRTHSYSELKNMINKRITAEKYVIDHAYNQPHESLLKNIDEILKRYVRIFKTYGQQKKVADTILDFLNLPKRDIQGLLTKGSQTEQELIDIIEELILDRFHIVSKSNSNSTMNVYDRNTRTIYKIRTHTGPALVNDFLNIVGRVTDYIEQNIGIPDWLKYETHGKVTTPKNSFVLSRDLSFYIKEALQDIISKASVKENCNIRKNGFYFCKMNEEKSVGYVVVNNMVYKYNYPSPIPECLDGPSDNNFIFQLSNENWLPWINDPEDFLTSALPEKLDDKLKVKLPFLHNESKNPKVLELQRLAEHLYNILNVGFRFQNQDIDLFIITMFMLAIPITDIFNKKTMLMITGEPHSGKSNLTLRVIAGKNGNDPINLIACAKGDENYTAASFRQTFSNSSTCVVLDEFEIKGSDDPRTSHCSQILSMLRGLESGKATSSRGTTEGIAQHVDFTSFVLFTGISIPIDSPDLTRILILTSDKQKEKVSPEVSILQTYTIEEIKAIKQYLATVLFPIAPDIHTIQNVTSKKVIEIRRKLDAEHIIGNVDRIGNTLYPILVMADFLELDLEDFLRTFLKTYGHELQLRVEAGDTESLLQLLLHTPIVPDTEELKSPLKTISYILSRSGGIKTLNKANVGCYYVEDPQWLVIHIPQSIKTIFRNSPYDKTTVSKVRSILSRSNLFVPEEVVIQTDILAKLGEYIGIDSQLKDMCVIHMPNKFIENNKLDEEMAIENENSIALEGEKNGI